MSHALVLDAVGRSFTERTQFCSIEKETNSTVYSGARLLGTRHGSALRRFSLQASSRPRVTAEAVDGSAVNAPPTATTGKKMTTLHRLWDEQQQSPWYDNLKRPINKLQDEMAIGIRGVTSNPTIFQKAISGSDLYDDEFGSHIKSGKSVDDAYWGVVVTDIKDAADVLKPIYDETNGLDGFISVEVSPELAADGPGTVRAAKGLQERIEKPNIFIKIPGTLECIPAIEEVIGAGISVNVTLIFSLARYEAVMEAYIRGLERASGDLSNIASVASFFVSRVDTLVDKKLEDVGTDQAKSLLGKAAIAQCKLAYEAYQKTFSGSRWGALAERGAHPQRLLWASTGTKNPKYPDTLYIDSLIGPGTVNTMPDAVLKAFLDHGKVARTIDMEVEAARETYAAVEELGIKWEDTGRQLEEEGVASFLKSFTDLEDGLKAKASALLN